MPMPASQETAVRIVVQFLRESGYTDAADGVERASGISHDDARLPRPALLMGALAALEEMDHLNAAAAVGAGSPERAALDAAVRALAGAGPAATLRALGAGGAADGRWDAGASVVSVRFSPAAPRRFAVATTDRALRVFDLDVGAESPAATLRQVAALPSALPAAALDIAWHPTDAARLAVGAMDGSVALLGVAPEGQLVVQQRFTPHRKYVGRVRWLAAADGGAGSLLLSASHDRSLAAFRVPAAGDADTEPIYRREFVGVVEAVAVTSGSGAAGAAGRRVLVTSRDDNYVHVLDLATGEELAQLNQNAMGDDHISFAAMDMALSADDEWAAIATDRDQLHLMHLPTGAHMRSYFGHSADAMSMPRVAWPAAAPGLLLATSQDYSLCVYDLVSARLLHRLRGHRAVVRCLDVSPEGRFLVCGSFDKSLSIWSIDG